MTDHEHSGDGPLVARGHVALRGAAARLPYLAGLCGLVRIVPSDDVSVAAVFRSGRVLVERRVLAETSLDELEFVLAHELLHLALQTHARQVGHDPWRVNVAHDAIINTLLEHELHLETPLGGICGRWDPAFAPALETLLLWYESVEQLWDGVPIGRRRRETTPMPDVAEPEPITTGLGDQLLALGLIEPKPDATGLGDQQGAPGLVEPKPKAGQLLQPDVLDDETERAMFPDEFASSTDSAVGDARGSASDDGHGPTAGAAHGSASRRRAEIDRAAIEAHAVLELARRAGNTPGRDSTRVSAWRDRFQYNWEIGLQHWLDGTVRPGRTWARASRRGALADGLTVPGRARHGLRVHVVLDSSGSMWYDERLLKVLGALASFTDAAGVDAIRIVHADTVVQSDETITPAELVDYEIRGGGGTDPYPALEYIAKEHDVAGVIVLTDGQFDTVPAPTGLQVLWVILGTYPFEPAGPLEQMVRVDWS